MSFTIYIIAKGLYLAIIFFAFFMHTNEVLLLLLLGFVIALESLTSLYLSKDELNHGDRCGPNQIQEPQLTETRC